MKLTELLKNVVVKDIDKNKILMNTAELEPVCFEMLLQDIQDNADYSEVFDMSSEEIFDKDFSAEEAVEYLKKDFRSQELVYWSYFLSEGHEPKSDEYYHGFPEVYVDSKEYEIIFNDLDYSYIYETDIDTM